MRIAGIIAEYNPFHPGHAYQLREARRLSGADCVAVVMSSGFTQRGEAAMFAPAVRARMALEQGADIVFALPACWAVRDAEHFALGGVRLLQLLGADAISFGAENADPSLLLRTARLMENPDALGDGIRAAADTGLSYPAALSKALREADTQLGAVLDSPNNTLAVCYLRAMLRLSCAMEVCPVKRIGSGYHDTAVVSVPSATAVRGLLERGDWHTLRSLYPPEASASLRREALEGRLHRAAALDQALLYRLRTMTDAEWHALPDLSEGIEDRLRKALACASTREELLQSAKTKRYPYARLSRLCAHALLGLTAQQLDSEPLPDALWLLGFRNSARPLLSDLKKRGVNVISKASAADSDRAWFRTELLAYDLWTLGCLLPTDLGLRQGVVHIE